MIKPKIALLACASVILSALVAGMVAEGIARVFFPSWAPRTGRVTEFWRYDPQYGWSHKPGYQGRFTSNGFDTSVRSNADGFRGPDIGHSKPAGTHRVVVLGDSFVWGFGVEEKDCFTHLLQEDASGALEVVNLGVSGYSTDQELLLYRNLGERYQPDLVILVVAANDFAANVLPVAYVAYGKPVFKLRNDQLVLTNQPVPQPPLLERFVVGLAVRSYVLNELNRVRESRSVDQALETPSEQSSSSGQRRFPATYPERLTVRLISEIKRKAELDGARFLVVLVDRIYGDHLFGDYLRSAGMDVIALDDAMTGPDDNLHLPDGLHWNARGHRIVADVLAPRIATILGDQVPH